MKKQFSILLVLLCLVLLLPLHASAEETDIYSFGELLSALNLAGQDTHFILHGSIPVEQGMIIPPGASVTLSTRPGDQAVLSSTGFEGAMFTVPKGSSLVLQGSEDAPVILRGVGEMADPHPQEDTAIISIGTFTAEYTAFENFSGDVGAAVSFPNDDGLSSAWSGTIHKCSFTGNRARIGGAFYIGSGRAVEISSSSFNANSAYEGGPAIYCAGSLSFGDRNEILSPAAPLEFVSYGNGFAYGQEIIGSGSFSVFEEPEPTPAEEILPEVDPAEAPTLIPEELPLEEMPLPEAYEAPQEAAPEFLQEMPIVSKDPTDETVPIGGSVIFIARAENSSGVVWHLISPDDAVDYAGEDIPAAFSDLQVEGLYEERLRFENVPIALSGWKVRAEFLSSGTSAWTAAAVIHVYDASTPTPAPTPMPAPTPTPAPTPQPLPEPTGPLSLVKSPTDETVEMGGKAIFIAKADNAVRIVWHVISPDGLTDLADNQILIAFPSLGVEGLGTEKLKLSNIPISMHGWKVKAEFYGTDSTVSSEPATVLIANYEALYEQYALETSAGGPDPNLLPPTQELLPPSAPVQPTPAPVQMTPVPVQIQEVLSPAGPATAGDLETRDITVSVSWNDSSNAAGKRPQYTIIELYRNDSLYTSAALNSSNNWSYTFHNLTEGNYKVREEPVTDYAVSYVANGNTVSVQHVYTGVLPTPSPVPTAAPTQAPFNPSQYVTTATSTPAPVQTSPVAAATVPPTATRAPSAEATPTAASTPAPTANPDIPVLPQSGSNFTIWIVALAAVGLILIASAVIIIFRKRR